MRVPTLYLVQVAGLSLGEQVGVGIFPGIHLVHKQRAEPAFVAALGKPPTHNTTQSSTKKLPILKKDVLRRNR